ncbi:hypothetical protein HUJ04_006294 [Dendroctonus ponderosae]|nr:hypothetical protein HUJ04_006294 [Dendroctonus ponderosae]
MACRNSVLKMYDALKMTTEGTNMDKGTLPYKTVANRTFSLRKLQRKWMPNSGPCTCTEGYTGQNCENEYIPCDPSPCANGGRCRSGDKHTYTCECPSVYCTTNLKRLKQMYEHFGVLKAQPLENGFFEEMEANVIFVMQQISFDQRWYGFVCGLSCSERGQITVQ